MQMGQGTMRSGSAPPNEGICVVCKKAIHEHVRADGSWKGCKPAREQGIKLLLVPDRRRVAREGDIAPVKTHQQKPLPETARVEYRPLYALSDKRVKALDSERDKGIYRLLALDKGLTRGELLKALDTDQTGIVDGALRRLRLKGLIQRVTLRPVR